MFKDVEDIERSWRSLKVEMSSYCNILHAMMTKVCVTVCAKCLIFFLRIQKWLEMMGLPPKEHRRWPCLRFELRLCRAPWDWLPHWNKTRCNPMIATGFDAWVWYLSQGLILALNKTRRNPMRTSQSYAARLTGSVNTSFARFSSPEVAPIPDYWSPVNDTQRHLQTIL